MNLVERAKSIVLTPRTEWQAIDAEPATVQDIYGSYVVPLTLIPVVAGFIGATLIGVGGSRASVFGGLFTAFVQFALSLALVYVMALIVDALAPTFGGRKDFLSA